VSRGETGRENASHQLQLFVEHRGRRRREFLFETERNDVRPVVVRPFGVQPAHLITNTLGVIFPGLQDHRRDALTEHVNVAVRRPVGVRLESNSGLEELTY